MITSIEFKNFKVLRQAKLPLGRCTVIVGPNGSGKSTVMQALDLLAGRTQFNRSEMVSFRATETEPVEIHVKCDESDGELEISWSYDRQRNAFAPSTDSGAGIGHIKSKLAASRVYYLNPREIAAPEHIRPGAEIPANGHGLVAAIDRLMCEERERFDEFNQEFAYWFPEYDRLEPRSVDTGRKALYLRVRRSEQWVPAASLSDGTLLAIALLGIAYVPNCPPIIGLEEPDHGLHPRLLRMVQDVMYRVSHPEGTGANHQPVQVIATTHSPYFLDLFKDHLDEVVIASKVEDGASFVRLSDQPYVHEVLDGAHLGEIWYSGILGGVPSEG